MTNNEFSKKAIRHGEVILVPLESLPKGAKLVEETKSFIAGHSESGHHHVLEAVSPFKIFEFEGKTYLDIPLEAKLTHQKQGTETHGIQILQPGFYERIIKKSFSYAKGIMERVQD